MMLMYVYNVIGEFFNHKLNIYLLGLITMFLMVVAETESNLCLEGRILNLYFEELALIYQS